MNQEGLVGLIFCGIPCYLVAMLAILLIWGAAALGWALLISVVLFAVFLMWVLC